jgi:hypothetical protein
MQKFVPRGGADGCWPFMFSWGLPASKSSLLSVVAAPTYSF